MALPPECITVKRRRDDDPIETLFIQSKKHRPSTVWTLATNLDNDAVEAVSSASSLPNKDVNLSALNSPNVANVTTLFPGSNHIKRPRDLSGNGDQGTSSERNPGASVINRPIRPGQANLRTVCEPRRFHLSKDSFRLSSPSSVSKPSMQKHSGIRKPELAVFVEVGEVLRKGPDHERQDLSENAAFHSIDKKNDHHEASVAPRKRPNATPEERRWRAENWNQSTKSRAPTNPNIHSNEATDKSSNELDPTSLQLAVELQRTSVEGSEAARKNLKENDVRQQLKFKPKPPRPRQRVVGRDIQEQNEDDTIMDTMPSDNSTEYVFDTYFRFLTNGEGIVEVVDPLEGNVQSNIGIIDIEDGEEEELWETFGEGAESDIECNSEEEDENAEDYYGNDYPEDEVDSDDERGRSAYNYRHYASDDEEFDEEEPSWSDDDKDE